MDAAAKQLSGAKRNRMNVNNISNKQKRSEIFHKQKREKKKEARQVRLKRKKEEEALGPGAVVRQTPHTQDNTREADDTVVDPDDLEVLGDEADDEFAAYFNGSKVPKLMITTKKGPSGAIYELIADMLKIFPNAFYYRRQNFQLSQICRWAASRELPCALPAAIVPRRYFESPSIVHLCERLQAHYLASSSWTHSILSPEQQSFEQRYQRPRQPHCAYS
jgi:ribosome production factor 1